jgi:predicted enzyme related to lactoylglutathione lyase
LEFIGIMGLIFAYFLFSFYRVKEVRRAAAVSADAAAVTAPVHNIPVFGADVQFVDAEGNPVQFVLEKEPLPLPVLGKGIFV